MTPDRDDFQHFVVARYPQLVRAAVLFGCSRPDAEDAVQDALVRCYASWGRVRAAEDRDAYVYRVLVNGITRGRRRRWRGEVPHEVLPEPAGQDPVADLPQAAAVRAGLARLSLEQRQVLVLRYFVDLSEAQIASVLAIAPGTVKSRAARAIAALSQDAGIRELVPPAPEEDR